MTLGPYAGGLPAAFGNAALPSGVASARFAVRVAVIHGNRMSGELLRSYCAGAWGCEVTTLESVGRDAVFSVERNQPDIMIVGHQPPTVNCLELLPQLRRAARAAKIIVTVPQLNAYLVHRLASLHLHAIVEEISEGIATIQTSIERVRDGERSLSPRFVQLAARLRSNPDAFPKILTGRQEAVLVCVAHAMSDAEIARTLGMSTSTAKRHRADIAHKLNLRGTPQQLIRYGIENGLNTVPPPSRQEANVSGGASPSFA